MAISGFDGYGDVAALPLLAGSLCALVVALSIRYARVRRLIDQPGQRRSHRIPTPRGGGIGIVVAALLCFCLPLAMQAQPQPRIVAIAIAIALLLVAAIGWIDDHRPLSARLRVVVHFLAALILLLPWLRTPILAAGVSAPPALLGLGMLLVALLLIVWSINLHNFMDGINGLLACQAVFVFVALALACADAGATHAMQQLLVLAAATLGFLPFNFPQARIFMGDVGSGALGLLIVVACLLTLDVLRSALLIGLIACSAFVTDATCTLLSRMWRGRRWYSAHREHLYQWLTRSGMSHARVVACYMAWNVVVVAPVSCWIVRHAEALNPVVAGAAGSSDAEVLHSLGWDWGAAIVVYGLAIALWIFGKRWCLQKLKSSRHRHAAA